MAKGVSIQVRGMDKLRKKLGQIPERVIQLVDAEMAESAEGFVNRAALAAPVDKGRLKGDISRKKLADMKHEVVSPHFYSPYVEFGTITRVQVPTDLVAYAAQFKGKGLKKTGGMHARPFFFPQLPIARAELKKSIPKAVRQALK